MPKIDERVQDVWNEILGNKDHHIIVEDRGGTLVSSCVLVIIRNLTHGQCPYGLIENVVTDKAYRKQGYATACLNYAREIAVKENCYKLMLLTGSKEESTLRLYERAGYNRQYKTGFVQWLP